MVLRTAELMTIMTCLLATSLREMGRVSFAFLLMSFSSLRTFFGGKTTTEECQLGAKVEPPRSQHVEHHTRSIDR